MKLALHYTRSGSTAGNTLVEVMVSIIISSMAIIASVNGYLLSANRSEWSGYSLAAHSMAMQRLEQARAAKWDTTAYPPVDNVVGINFPVTTNVLDVPISGTNVLYATNFTTITTVSANPPLKMLRVDCVWPFYRRGLYTNTVISYRAPDQ